jgi:hypothetical protein
LSRISAGTIDEADILSVEQKVDFLSAEMFILMVLLPEFWLGFWLNGFEGV